MESIKRIYPDPVTFILLLLLFTFGELTILSIKVFPYLFEELSIQSFRRPVLHGISFLIGVLIAGFVAHNFNYRRLNNKKLIYTLVGFSIALLTVVLIKKFASQMSVNRWLIGTSIQPSEFSKLILIIFVAYYISKKGYIDRVSYLAWVAFIAVAHSLLLFLQPDRGMAIFILLSTFILLWFGGVSPRIYLPIGAFFAFVSLFMLKVGGSYIDRRFYAWKNPLQDPYDSGYHILQSFLSFINGGFFGMGPGFGLQKLGYLTQADTDYILAIIGEEFGFIGVFFLSTLYLLLVSRLIFISMRIVDTFGRILAVGVIINLLLSILISYYMAINLLPPKGIPLPFVSYGVSNMLANLLGIGLIGAIYRRQITYDIDRI